MATPYGYYWESTQDLAVRSIVTYHPVSVQQEPPSLPEIVTLYQNTPNPFNASTTIPFTLPQRAHVVLTIYDVLGRQVTTLLDEERLPGRYSVRWDGVDVTGKAVSSGVYLYELRVGTTSQCRKMVVVR